MSERLQFNLCRRQLKNNWTIFKEEKTIFKEKETIFKEKKTIFKEKKTISFQFKERDPRHCLKICQGKPLKFLSWQEIV